MTQKSDFGYLAEEMAAEYLIGKGYQIKDRNFRRPWGELDIVATKDGVVVFCEVKANSRPMPDFDPSLRAGYVKLHKVVRSAEIYLSMKKFPENQPWQVDLLTVVLDREQSKAKITHFKNITEL